MRVPEVLAIAVPQKIFVGKDGQPLHPEDQTAIRVNLPRLRHWFPRLRDEAVLDNIADEAAQKLAAFRALNEVHDSSTLAWTILRRTACSWFRTAGARMGCAEVTLVDADRLKGPHGIAEIEARAILHELLMRLSPNERLIYLLKTHGYRSRAIADDVGVTEANVNTIFSRARTKLARLASSAPRRVEPKREE